MAGVTPIADVPDAPTIGAATNVGTSRAYNNGSATVAYTAAATGGPVTTFTATSSPGSFTGTGASPITVTGLQSATSYTFTVSAANANGTLTSAASSSITATTVPNAPTIGTATSPPVVGRRPLWNLPRRSNHTSSLLQTDAAVDRRPYPPPLVEQHQEITYAPRGQATWIRQRYHQ